AALAWFGGDGRLHRFNDDAHVPHSFFLPDHIFTANGFSPPPPLSACASPTTRSASSGSSPSITFSTSVTVPSVRPSTTRPGRSRPSEPCIHTTPRCSAALPCFICCALVLRLRDSAYQARNSGSILSIAGR